LNVSQDLLEHSLLGFGHRKWECGLERFEQCPVDGNWISRTDQLPLSLGEQRPELDDEQFVERQPVPRPPKK
jgi:hypothetical protein